MIPIARNDAERWGAVLRRDARADGDFVYAVRSTGVYCRPSCPSRRPRREVVAFFASPGDAETAGFRACRRCRPCGPSADLITVEAVCQEIREHFDQPLRLAALARNAGLSPGHLQRIFHKVMGISPRQYAEALRLAALKEGLRGGRPVLDAVYSAGYGAGSRVYEAGRLGMTPATYGRGGRGARISYTVAGCPLGTLLVAATDRGVCAVRLADDEPELVNGLAGEYPAAEVRRDDQALQPWVGGILEMLEGREPRLPLPLELRATAFQWRVWEELRRIPRGETRSYGQIARAIGKSRAARAVARACASNPVALAIPCHRVVREDGSPGGYRWGAGRKRTLLERERQVPADPSFTVE